MGVNHTMEERVRRALGSYRACEARGIPLGAPVSPNPRVTVVVPTYKGEAELLNRAVQSILDQTYANLRCVVVSDGDEEPPWDELPQDPRLVKFRLSENRGQFFATDVVLRATPDPLLIIQDDDDVSDPKRIEELVKALLDTDADYVLTDIEKIPPGREKGRTLKCHFDVELSLHTSVMYHLGPHMGLFKTEALRLVGGYAGDIRLGYDTYVVALMGRLGRIAYLPKVLYRQYQRGGSMTLKGDTSMLSKRRRDSAQTLANRWVRIQHSNAPFAMARNINRNARKELEASLVEESGALCKLFPQ